MELNRFLEEIINGTNEYLEIREIDHEGNVTQHFLKQQDINKYTPPKDKNVYFGVFSRNKKSGKTRCCNTTRVLWLDFDKGMMGLSVEERVKKVQDIIMAVGLPKASILISSGNGIHAYWLLKERQQEVTEVLRIIADITDADIKATDKARIMRLPGTLNIKDKERPLEYKILQADYSLIYDYRLFKELLKDCIGQVSEKPLKAKLELTKSIIDEIKTDRPCIEKIIKGVSKGERNFALGRLTKWLQVKGFPRDISQQAILDWNNRNNPPESITKLIKDFNMYWYEDYKLLGCKINKPELQQILDKYCNRPDCNFSMSIGNINLDKMVRINNRLLNDIQKLTGNDLLIYSVLVRNKEGLTTSALNEELINSSGKICMSNKTILDSLSTLKKLGYVKIINGNKRKREENFYKAISQSTFGLGYTLVSNDAINKAIERGVSPGGFRLYVLLLKYAYNKGICNPSLNTLAKELRTTSSNISILLKRLEESKYIRREYKKQLNGVKKLVIRLLV